MSVIDPYLPHTRIAYFSMEIALRGEMHTYSGGLGVLAGDSVRSAADLKLPMVFVTMVSRQGYLRQEIGDDGSQIEQPDLWEPEQWAHALPEVLAANVQGRDVWVRPWLYEWVSHRGHKMPIILLDTQVERNDPADRSITDRLYGGDAAYRLKQEVVLGIGGEQVLRSLGFNIDTYHLNEGHAALLPFALLRRQKANESGPDAVETVKKRCVFTTHTPVEAGHDRFDYDLVARILGSSTEIDEMKELGGQDHLNMTRLALNLSSYVNGVSVRHAELTRDMFPGYRIHAVTNGVHPRHWTHPAFAALYETIAEDWDIRPEALASVAALEDEFVWRAHEQAKRDLVAMVRSETGERLEVDRPIIGFARRMTSYKRAGLLLSDWARLSDIHGRHPFQLILSGKAHPKDADGKRLIQEVAAQARRAGIPVAFVPDYNMEAAKLIVAGADIWLNTPLPPLEASGTSGMKAALNGVLNLSTLDGWWLEGCEEGITGWGIGPQGSSDEHARILYEKLEQTILPLYDTDRLGWIRMMKQAISRIGPVFNTQRMMNAYAREAYALGG